MAKERLSMRKFREILRLKFDQNLTNRQIAGSCGMSHVTVGKYLDIARHADITWPIPDDIDDTALESTLFKNGKRTASGKEDQMPSMKYLFEELKRSGVTLQLLWYEHKQNHPEGYQYSYFCERYQKWVKQLDVSLRQEYRAGEKLFIDYAGQTLPVTDPETGENNGAQLFVAAMGASNYTFAEVTLSQQLPDWIASHVRAFEFFGGVPEILVPDNLKSGITSPSRYEPDINPTYLELATHYGTTVIPARVAKPRDKAKVESAVLIAERWILAVLRNHTFFSLAEANQAIARELIRFNDKKLQKLDVSRKELFATTDQPVLTPLPIQKYEYAEWKKARVNIDYHIEFDGNYYSVPYTLRKEQVDVRFTNFTIEILFKNNRVASHRRLHRKGGFTTTREHMPKAHQEYLEWTPSRIQN
ncbi:MAG: IS21 family transposase, partial [Candidatus Zhuqueibacterota bacterium]